MPSPNRPVPATLESLYRIAIKDTLDQSLGRRNADDIQDVRQSLAALDKTLAHQRLAIDALENENRALKTANEKLSTAVDKLLVSQEQQATMGKTAMRTLQQHVLQVDQRQSELETKYDEIERAFEQTAQLMQPSESTPPSSGPESGFVGVAVNSQVTNRHRGRSIPTSALASLAAAAPATTWDV